MAYRSNIYRRNKLSKQPMGLRIPLSQSRSTIDRIKTMYVKDKKRQLHQKRKLIGCLCRMKFNLRRISENNEACKRGLYTTTCCTQRQTDGKKTISFLWFSFEYTIKLGWKSIMTTIRHLFENRLNLRNFKQRRTIIDWIK